MPEKLKQCPCGVIPDDLCIEEGRSSKWAFASCGKCGEWTIEFRTNYLELGSIECKDIAYEAWNNAPRGEKNDI